MDEWDSGFWEGACGGRDGAEDSAGARSCRRERGAWTQTEVHTWRMACSHQGMSVFQKEPHYLCE